MLNDTGFCSIMLCSIRNISAGYVRQTKSLKWLLQHNESCKWSLHTQKLARWVPAKIGCGFWEKVRTRRIWQWHFEAKWRQRNLSAGSRSIKTCNMAHNDRRLYLEWRNNQPDLSNSLYTLFQSTKHICDNTNTWSSRQFSPSRERTITAFYTALAEEMASWLTWQS